MNIKIRCYWWNLVIIAIIGYFVVYTIISFFVTCWILGIIISLLIVYFFSLILIKSIILFDDKIIIFYPTRLFFRNIIILNEDVQQILYEHPPVGAPNVLIIKCLRTTKRKESIYCFGIDCRARKLKGFLQQIANKGIAVKIKGSDFAKDYYTPIVTSNDE